MTRKMTDDEAKRSPLNLRTTRDIREKLEQAAAEGGRSLTQEAERRLARSFDVSSPSFEDVRLMIREEIRAALDAVKSPARRPCGRLADIPCPNHSPFAHQCACEGVHAHVL